MVPVSVQRSRPVPRLVRALFFPTVVAALAGVGPSPDAFARAYSHPHFPALTPEQARLEVYRADLAVRRATGHRPVAFRFPSSSPSATRPAGAAPPGA